MAEWYIRAAKTDLDCTDNLATSTNVWNLKTSSIDQLIGIKHALEMSGIIFDVELDQDH